MAGCLENVSIPPCIWFEGDDKRNALASLLSGILFFAGWWFIIDVAAAYPDSTHFNHAYHLCGVFGTLSFLMINTVSNSQVRGDGYSGGCLGPRGARAWLFLGFVIGFGSLIASCWILFAAYVAYGSNLPTYPGVGLFLQNVLIFVGSLVFKFGRHEDHWN